MDNFDPAGMMRSVTGSAPSTLQTSWGGVKGAASWGLTGGLAGAAVGGLPGAVVGAGAGILSGMTFGLLSESSRQLSKWFKYLEESTKALAKHFERFSPVAARLVIQWELLDRRISGMWARTLEPMLKMTSDYAREMKEREEERKVRVYEAREPYRRIWILFKQEMGSFWMDAKDWFSGIYTDFLNKFTPLMEKMLEKLGLLEWFKQLGAKPPWAGEEITPLLQMPEARGLMGAGGYAFAKGPPFTSEDVSALRAGVEKYGREQAEIREYGAPKAERDVAQYKRDVAERSMIREEGKRRRQEEGWTEEETDAWIQERLDTQQREIHRREQGSKPRSPLERGIRTQDVWKPSAQANVNVNVSDSVELANAFTKVWQQTLSRLRQWEAENTYLAFRMQEESSYV